MRTDEIVTELGVDAVKILGDEVKKKIENYVGKPHGSKVKAGDFKDCTIELAEDKAFIVVKAKKSEIVWLSSEQIQSYRFVKKKKKLRKGKFKTYYYYTITFKDGRESYVRMRKKYLKAMKKHTNI